jgi:hypothetical protein
MDSELYEGNAYAAADSRADRDRQRTGVPAVYLASSPAKKVRDQKLQSLDLVVLLFLPGLQLLILDGAAAWKVDAFENCSQPR